jgi:hypothetical protein
MSRVATLAAGLLCAALSWGSQAQAISYTATYNISDAGGVFGGGVNHFDGPGRTNIDTITVNLTGPGIVESSALAGTVALNISFGPFNLAGFSSISWMWQSDNLLTNVSGTFSNIAQNVIDLPFTATTPAGAPYASYHLYIVSTTSGLAGGGYVYSLAVQACPACNAPPPPPPSVSPPAVPVPPAAILFISGLAGLGFMGRKRRKSGSDAITQQ